MKTLFKLGLLAVLFQGFLVNAAERAAANVPAAPLATIGIQQSFIGLIIVLVAIVFVAWIMRRLPQRAFRPSRHLKVVEHIAVGTKERISLIELADTWVLIGITATQIHTLHTMAKIVPADSPAEVPVQPFANLLEVLRSRRSNA
jgi:flagellar protein FliO/FliZ